MKIGDTIPVNIAGQTVANATVKEVGDGTATLVVPATLIVMATRTELSYETPAPVEPERETIITGVDQAGEADRAVGSEATQTNELDTDALAANMQALINNMSQDQRAALFNMTPNTTQEPASEPSVNDVGTSIDTNNLNAESVENNVVDIKEE